MNLDRYLFLNSLETSIYRTGINVEMKYTPKLFFNVAYLTFLVWKTSQELLAFIKSFITKLFLFFYFFLGMTSPPHPVQITGPLWGLVSWVYFLLNYLWKVL